MRKAYQLVVCLFAVSLLLVLAGQRAEAQNRRSDYDFDSVRAGDFSHCIDRFGRDV